VILAQYMQKLQGFIDEKQFNNAVFSKIPGNFIDFQNFVAAKLLDPVL